MADLGSLAAVLALGGLLALCIVLAWRTWGMPLDEEYLERSGQIAAERALREHQSRQQRRIDREFWRIVLSNTEAREVR